MTPPENSSASSEPLIPRTWEDYKRIYAYSLKNNDLFWDRVAKIQLLWREKWKHVSKCDYLTGEVSWFLGGKLNVAENCIDRHLELGRADKVALIWIGNEPNEQRKFTFRELYEEVCKVTHTLEALGIKKGDRVGIYLPNIPELAFSMLACARIGAIHSVIFGGFSPHSIQSRMNNCGAKLIITATGTFRGNKWIDLKTNIDRAMEMGCPSVKQVLVIPHSSHSNQTQTHLDLKPYELNWNEVLQSYRPHTPVSHESKDPLFILYTSGSTGEPKGVLHTMGGYLTYASYTHEVVFQPRETDVYWCTADLGWITGHTYLLYGPLANGTTSIMFEGVPHYPTPSRFWEIVDQYQVNIFYTAPTAIRILASAGNEAVLKTSRHSLRTLGTVGEPINPEVWKWYSSIVGRDKCPVVDTWWQTETGGILISPLAGITPTKAGCATLPLPGIEPRILAEDGTPILDSAQGSLVITRSWPGQMVGVFGDTRRFYETYFTHFPGTYFTGDGARKDEEGYYWILGRIDDVIKVSGHRLGTAEIESACLTHPEVVESAAIGVPDEITGEALCVFVVLKNSPESNLNLKKILTDIIRREVGPLATPKKILFIPGLPKTRSGKIMRRILKKCANHEFDNLGDLSTLADPGVVEKIITQLKNGDSA